LDVSLGVGPSRDLFDRLENISAHNSIMQFGSGERWAVAPHLLCSHPDLPEQLVKIERESVAGQYSLNGAASVVPHHQTQRDMKLLDSIFDRGDLIAIGHIPRDADGEEVSDSLIEMISGATRASAQVKITANGCAVIAVALHVA
jgi:hypothetical protein